MADATVKKKRKERKAVYLQKLQKQDYKEELQLRSAQGHEQLPSALSLWQHLPFAWWQAAWRHCPCAASPAHVF